MTACERRQRLGLLCLYCTVTELRREALTRLSKIHQQLRLNGAETAALIRTSVNTEYVMEHTFAYSMVYSVLGNIA